MRALNKSNTFSPRSWSIAILRACLGFLMKNMENTQKSEFPGFLPDRPSPSTHEPQTKTLHGSHRMHPTTWVPPTSRGLVNPIGTRLPNLLLRLPVLVTLALAILLTTWPGPAHAQEAANTSPNSGTAATGTLVIQGTTETDGSLTAKVGDTVWVTDNSIDDIEDADGMTAARFRYRWMRAPSPSGTFVAIGGANSSLYTLSSADEEKWLRLQVDFYDDARNHEELLGPVIAVAGNSPATGVPTIAGTTKVGQTLVASTDRIADADGLNSARYRYQWLREDSESGIQAVITGATRSWYTLLDADLGKMLRVRVSFIDDAGNSEKRLSEGKGPVLPDTSSPPSSESQQAATGQPIIEGTPRVGEVLSVRTDQIVDPNGISQAQFTYKWYYWNGRGWYGFSGDSSSILRVGSLFQGKHLRVKVSFEDDAGNREEVYSPNVRVAYESDGGRPVILGRSRILGTPRLGQLLTVSTADISDPDGLTSPNFRYQWQQSLSPLSSRYYSLSGATAPSFRPSRYHVGYSLRVKVTFTDDSGNTHEITSYSVRIVTNSGPRGRPTIEGASGRVEGRVGDLLTVSTAEIEDDDGLTSPNFKYQWQQWHRGRWSYIPDATGVSFRPGFELQGGRIRVEATFTDDFGNVENAVSSYLTISSNTPPYGRPVIQGTERIGARDAARVGQLLTVSTTAIQDRDGLTSPNFKYQWQQRRRSDGRWFDIRDVTGAAFRAGPGSQGERIRVKVTFTDDFGNVETVYSHSSLSSGVAIVENSRPLGKPVIQGTPGLGRLLTVSTAGITDADGLSSPIFRYEWQCESSYRPCWRRIGYQTVQWANGPTWSTAHDYHHFRLRVKVTFTDDSGNTETLYSEEVSVPPFDEAEGYVYIAGSPVVGSTLTAATELIRPEGLTFSYEWFRANSATDDSSSATRISSDQNYQVVGDDVGKYIFVVARVTSGNSEVVRTSARTRITGPANQQASGSPDIGDTAKAGEELIVSIANVSDGNGLTSVTYGYLWQRRATSGGLWNVVRGADAESYTPVTDDQGKSLRATVVFVDDAGYTETLTSNEVTVQDSVVASGAPVIEGAREGVTRVGEMLTANPSGIDEGAPELSIADASVAEGAAGESATLTFTVTLDPAATQPVTVEWATADGTATAGTDYTAVTNGTLTFESGQDSKTVTVTVTGDDVDEPNETFTVTLTNAPGATLVKAVGTGTITDDDDAPTVTLVLTPDSISENGGTSRVTATLDHPSSEETTVTVAVTPESPAVADDYRLVGNQLTIAANSLTSTGEVTITAVDNEVDALDKEVTVSATAENTQGITAPPNVTLTITDDDAPELAIGDASVTEGDLGESATLEFTVTLDPAATLPVTVEWATSDGTAEAGTDYTAVTNGTLTFEPGQDSKTVTVTVTGDDADEPNETLTVTLTNAPGATITDATGTGTITDDDGPAAVTLVLTPASIGENGGKSTVTATLDRPSSAATTVRVSAAPVSPAVANDYRLVGSQLTIAANSLTSTGEVTITAVDNEVDALDKEVTVSATAENTQGITAPPNVTLTITDDDAPELAIGDASVTEGDLGESVTLEFTVTLDPAATLPVTVEWATSDGTAEAGTDYTAVTNETLTFEPGQDSKTVTVTVTGDDADEPNETLTVTVTNESGATITDATGTGTITDDDGPAAVTLVLTPASIGENGGKSTVTATLDRPSSAATTVRVSAAPVSPAVANDYRLVGSQLTIAANSLTSTGEVTITAVDNEVDALDKEVTVSATAENTQGITAPPNVTLTITDDDAPELAIGDASVTEGDLGESATLEFTVTLDPAATLPVTVEWATSDGTAEAGTDYTAVTNETLTFEPGQDSKTVTVTVTGDDADEPNETLTVTLTNESGATITDATGTGTITDDDGPAAVTLVLTPASIGENGGKSTVTATLDRPSSAATTVRVSAAPVSPAVANDYRLVGSQLTIAANSLTSTGEVTITAVDNEVDALDKEVTVSATAENTQGITAPPNVTLTITDDDAPELAIGDASVTEGDLGESVTLEFTVTLDPAATLPVTVEWATSDGTAEAGTDYTAVTNETLTFEPGQDSKTVTVTVTGDDADEPNETLTVTVTNESGATITDATGTGTITDDDGPAAVTLVLTPASIGENGGKSTVTATLDRPSSAATTVRVSAAPVSPAVANDYRLVGSQLTIAANSLTSTGEVTITAVDNEVDALDKEVTVSATAENTQGITAPPNVTLTITDDDAPELAIGDASVTEGDLGESVTLEFTVTLDPAATLPVTVEWATSDGTAEAGTDYTAVTNETLTFEPGQDSKTVTVTVTGDDADEPNETLTVTVTNESGATITDATGTGTITDDDGPAAVTLVLTPASIGENGGKSTVTATLDRPSSAATTVRVSAAPVSPAVANDYRLVGSQLTIAANSLTSTGEVTITAVDNEVDALDKEVTVSATAENTQGITAPPNVTLTITDDDAPELAIGDASVTEGDLGESATLEFTVTLDPAATLPVTVEWATSDGTAEAGTDYTAVTNETLTFEPGQDSKTVTVTVTGDDADEPNETLTVTLTNESGATITDATGTGTITDDDGPAAVTLVLTPASIGENGGKSTVTATLDRPSSAATTVRVSAAPVSPAVANDYRLVGSQLTIAANSLTSTGEVTITAVDNEVDALDKEVTVSATAENTQGITAPPNVTLTITDDDAPELAIGDASVTEGDLGESATLEFTVTLDPAATLPVTVEWATSDGTAEAGTDYTAVTNETLTFEPGQDSKTVTVTVTGDDADEPNETLTVTLTNVSGGGATIEDATGTGTITDDDLPVVTVAGGGM